MSLLVSIPITDLLDTILLFLEDFICGRSEV